MLLSLWKEQYRAVQFNTSVGYYRGWFIESLNETTVVFIQKETNARMEVPYDSIQEIGKLPTDEELENITKNIEPYLKFVSE